MLVGCFAAGVKASRLDIRSLVRFRSFDGAASIIQQSADLNALIQWLFDRGLNKSPLIIGYYFYCVTSTALVTTVLLLDDYLLYY